MIILVAVLLSRLVHFFLHEEVLPRLQIPAGADNTVLTLVKYGILTFGLLLAAGAAGLNTTQLTVVFGALGVGIGFGLQHVVNDFVSGLLLLFERQIKVGDRIETDGRLGIVKRIGMRATCVQMLDGSEVVVPNGELVSRSVINWTLSDPERRTELRVQVGYDSDPERVIEVLKGVASKTEGVLPDPEPVALMVRFGESGLEFRLLFWTLAQDILAVSSQIHVTVIAALREAEIEIPMPQLEVKVLPGDSSS